MQSWYLFSFTGVIGTVPVDLCLLLLPLDGKVPVVGGQDLKQ